MNYRSAGVDVRKGDRFAKGVGALAKATLNSRVLRNETGYASLYKLNSNEFIAASTDGVGTKLKLAFELGKHDTVGIDLVAMCVNDLICVGAKPLFFLDYYATGKLKTKIANSVLKGVVLGCRQSSCSLVGGETAEMPGIYGRDEYDLAGFAVGLARKSTLLPKGVKAGDQLIAVGSSGFHSNGFSLIRRVLPKSGPKRRTLMRKLIRPTKIYVDSIWPLIEKNKVKALAHITGSGLKNIGRISKKFDFEVYLPKQSSVFEWVQERSGMKALNMARTFNMGVGMVIVCSPYQSSGVIRHLQRSGENAWVLGEVVRKQGRQSGVFIVGESDKRGKYGSTAWVRTRI